jgi:hypothetical protein
VKLFPYARLTLKSSLDPDEVAARLRKMVTEPAFSFRPPPEPFRGHLDGRRFKLTRVPERFLGVPTRNSFRPVIIGNIEQASDGAVLRITMRLHALVFTFMTIWFGFLFCVAGFLLWAGLREGFGPSVRRGQHVEGPGVGLVFVGGMFALASALVNVSFWMEVRKARSIFRDELKCHEVECGSRLLARSSVT